MSVTWRELGCSPLTTGINPELPEWMGTSIIRFEDGQIVFRVNHAGVHRSISAIFLGSTLAQDDRVHIDATFVEADEKTGRPPKGMITVINAECDHVPVLFYGSREDILRRLAIGMQKTIRAHLCGAILPRADWIEGSEIPDSGAPYGRWVEALMEVLPGLKEPQQFTII